MMMTTQKKMLLLLSTLKDSVRDTRKAHEEGRCFYGEEEFFFPPSKPKVETFFNKTKQKDHTK